MKAIAPSEVNIMMDGKVIGTAQEVSITDTSKRSENWSDTLGHSIAWSSNKDLTFTLYKNRMPRKQKKTLKKEIIKSLRKRQ